jgi:glycosyltransferase involved in cell wall biosynthesis
LKSRLNRPIIPFSIMKPPISVIIRTSNSEKALTRLLRHLQKGPDDEFIVVDTDSRDGTVAVAERAGARVLANTGAFNYSKTLNVGFAAAKNHWLLALSAHCVPIRADMLDCYRNAIAAVPNETCVIYGFQFWSQQQYASADKEPRALAGPVAGGSNSNALYARAAWSKHPFDETLKTGEDLEWQLWAKQAGLLSASAPAAAVFYLHQGSPSYRFTKAWHETLVGSDKIVPMSVAGLFRGIAQASRRLLWEAHAPRPWMGQVAHQLGSFLASRSPGSRR